MFLVVLIGANALVVLVVLGGGAAGAGAWRQAPRTSQQWARQGPISLVSSLWSHCRAVRVTQLVAYKYFRAIPLYQFGVYLCSLHLWERACPRASLGLWRPVDLEPGEPVSQPAQLAHAIRTGSRALAPHQWARASRKRRRIIIESKLGQRHLKANVSSEKCARLGDRRAGGSQGAKMEICRNSFNQTGWTSQVESARFVSLAARAPAAPSGAGPRGAGSGRLAPAATRAAARRLGPGLGTRAPSNCYSR